MEWRQNEMMVIVNGQARGVRGGVTVTADRRDRALRPEGELLTRRHPGYPHRQSRAPPRRPRTAATNPAATAATNPARDGGQQPGRRHRCNNEIYRLEAEGNVHIFTATDLAVGDKAIYDIDQAVLLMTGSDMKLSPRRNRC